METQKGGDFKSHLVNMCKTHKLCAYVRTSGATHTRSAQLTSCLSTLQCTCSSIGDRKALSRRS